MQWIRSTRRPAAWLVAALALTTLMPAWAQQDRNAERAQRRLQMQLQGLQQQLQEAQSARDKTEAERAELAKRQQQDAAALARATAAQQRIAGQAKTSQAALAARVAELEGQLAEQKRTSDEALQGKARELAAAGQRLQQGQAEQATLQGRVADQERLVGECTEKNQRMAQLSLELMDRYRHKSVADVLAQREPLFGLGDVGAFNLVQDYRDQADAARFKPGATR